MKFDDYLPCQAYTNQPKHTKNTQFSAFFDAASSRYFFALLDKNGNVAFKSEGYPQEKSRDNGIESVLKNKDTRDRYAVKSENSEFFVSLRAGNRQEIARSCGFATESAANDFIGQMFGEVASKVETKVAAKPAAAKVETIVATKPAVEKIETKIAAKVETKVATAKPTVGKVETKIVVEPALKVVEKTTAPAVKGEKIYLAPELYLGYPTLMDEYGPTGYALFTGPDAKHYFTVYNPDGSIYLRSEGFPTTKQCEEVLDVVKTNIVNPEKYLVKEATTGFEVVLVDEKETEIARSTEFDSFTAAFVTTPKGRTKTEGVNLY